MVDFLEGIDLGLAARYLEYLIDERKEDGAGFHERLAETYLRMVVDARRRGDEGACMLVPAGTVGSLASIRTPQGSVPEATQVHRHDRALQRGSAICASAVGRCVARASLVR